MADIHIQCDCSCFEGVLKDVSPKTGTHIVCYCSDCQAFQEYLGKSDIVLDAHGGTDIYQTRSSRLEIVKGGEHLACLRVTPKGVYRWYAACCRTAIGNTPVTRNIAITGLITHAFHGTTEGGDAGEAIGPLWGVVFPKSARGDISNMRRANLPALMGTLLLRSLKARITGSYKQTPFFTDEDEPVAAPYVLTPEERAEIDKRLERNP